ncbi:MAG: hypothetical protein ABI333_17205 [bacterium]
MFTPGAVRRAFAPLIPPLQRRLCHCLKNMPLEALPRQLRLRLSTTPMSGSARAVLDYVDNETTPQCLSALMACAGKVLVYYKSWYLPGCTPGSTAILTAPLRVALRPTQGRNKPPRRSSAAIGTSVRLRKLPNGSRPEANRRRSIQ